MIKKLLIFLVLLSIVVPFADAVPLSDKTGLKFTFPVKTDDYSFVVEATGNLDITNLDFDKEKKSITLFVLSSLENNSLEVSFPNKLIGGNYSIFLDGEKFTPKLQTGSNTTFVTMDFIGMGKHNIMIVGTTYLDVFEIKDVIDYKISTGYVDDISENQSTNSIIFTLFDPGDNGILSIQLSDDVMMPFDDGSFVVMIDDVESDYVLDGDTMNISFNSNNEKIEIFGTYVVPEFYEIAPLVLATSFIGLIVLRKYKKLFI
ncbi:MAG: hypothetical protein HOM82_01790 [Thaumarchaeota archaeon]|jgi:hypothetical protein|nr:hypothetical protein [Nitrososphaerota archaeon]MBT3744078.1 hypothetical protein [Nitrososphaerota archaeon]MBT4057035.1 hypothetical protein [Nitrososphaerota archaeon]MBT4175659.1 hypothetical protein [Nitrososphaerota archaeon]MBT4509939.1 hypothetical protein [Nitrososphaerota archaeon]